MPTLKYFKFWCQSVLPLVYDDSLSYYEVLCKVVKYINELITSDKEIVADIEGIKQDLAIVQKWIDEFDTSYAEEIIADYIATAIFFGLTDTGYFVAFIPNSWDDITFETTGWDVEIPNFPEYGHLCLAY